MFGPVNYVNFDDDGPSQLLEIFSQFFSLNKMSKNRAAVVAQLVEQLLVTPEIRGSNPVNGKLYLLSTVLQMSLHNKTTKLCKSSMLKNISLCFILSTKYSHFKFFC